ncbi:ABC transporter permease [Candidatus Contubernalis alkalaceticus]|uniref:ABC transporter permease n=1 Tax=Candidatus Contubernalis alkaliaceticus TaxID=338645 RepID=UPI0029622E91|nr:ABC transporter permease [Candidatus Contubernalis alkalaceticus]
MKNAGWTSRIMEYILTFMVIITLNFMLPRMMPGDPFLHLSAEGGEEVWAFTAEQRQYFLEYYGLDRPLPEQYVRYVTGLVQGDMGMSYYYKEDVSSIIMRRLPWTLMIVSGATFLSLFLGIVLGSFSAFNRESWKDKSLYLTMIVFSEIPAFLLGIVLLIIFAAGMGLFPLAGAMSHFANYTGWEQIKDVLHHAALPIVTLAMARAGGIYLLVRNTFTTVMGKDYIRTARAKGLSKGRIRYYHALRNALLPLVTRIALQMGAMVGGAVLVENVFAYPGLGRLMREAVFVRDYPLLQGIFLVLAFGVLGANLLADLLYKVLDPRTRGQE